jgi:hypothetical protein
MKLCISNCRDPETSARASEFISFVCDSDNNDESIAIYIQENFVDDSFEVSVS